MSLRSLLPLWTDRSTIRARGKSRSTKCQGPIAQAGCQTREKPTRNAPAPTPWPNAKQSNRRTLHLRTHLRAGESPSAKWEAIRKAAVIENIAKTRSTHDLCYTIMKQGKSHGRDR